MATAPNVGTGSGIQTVSTDRASQVYVVPIYSTMDAAGTASLETVIQVNNNMEYDVMFDYDLANEQKSAHLVSGFNLTGNGTSLDVSMRSAGAAAFKAVLEEAIDSAIGVAGGDADGKTVQQYLYNDAKNTFKDVFADSIANILESNWSLSVTVDSAGAGNNMYNSLDAESGQRKLRAVATQLPEDNFVLYQDASENPVTSALPLKDGDQLVFLFNTTSDYIARLPTKVADATSSTTAGDASYPTGTGTSGTNAGSAATASGGSTAASGTGVGSDAANIVGGNGASTAYGSAVEMSYIARQFIAAFRIKVKGTVPSTHGSGANIIDPALLPEANELPDLLA